MQSLRPTYPARPPKPPMRSPPMPRPPMPSPMVLSDRLITLAQDADRAGYAITAEHLVHLAHTVFEEPPKLA